MQRTLITFVLFGLTLFIWLVVPSRPALAGLSDEDAVEIVPASADELFAYLQSGAYKAFPHESAPHPSVGPHGQVQTYINPVLAASLAAGNEAHPVGAAAVKELYGDGEVTGWAVYVKTKAESAEGRGFYWYEIYSTTDPGQPVADGEGVPLCTACHSAGRDFTLSRFPLR